MKQRHHTPEQVIRKLVRVQANMSHRVRVNV